jgi:hypothetical protein
MAYLGNKQIFIQAYNAYKELILVNRRMINFSDDSIFIQTPDTLFELVLTLLFTAEQIDYLFENFDWDFEWTAEEIWDDIVSMFNLPD